MAEMKSFKIWKFLTIWAALVMLSATGWAVTDNSDGDPNRPAVASAVAAIADLLPVNPWIGVHVGIYHRDAIKPLVAVVPSLGKMGVNVLVVEINYAYEYESHPELRDDGACRKEQIKALVAVCRASHIRLIPQFNCLGHQSWEENTARLLTKYPQFEEKPGPDYKKKIYCRSWCPLHPEVNPIVFALMDELIEVFETDAFHVGMDEVFLIGEDGCPRCKGKDKAELFAKAVRDYHSHIAGKHKLKMLMWADRLIDAEKISYGEWEASINGTAGAIDLIPKDIILCDWHYEPRREYESLPLFLEKGFRVWPCSWKDVSAAKGLIDYSRIQTRPGIIGHLCTTWGSVPSGKLPEFEPLLYALKQFTISKPGN